MRVYGDLISGNCYKVKLLMSHLDLEHEWIHVDILAGEARTADFRVKNPIGKVPVLELPDGRCLAESNAILCYLADGTPWFPADAWPRALILQWLFFEQHGHERYIAERRFIARYLGMPAERRAEYEAKHANGLRALGIMEQRLAEADYLVGERPTIADIALYAYTHVADEGGFDVTPFAGITRWLGRLAEYPRHVAMPPSA